VGCGYFALEDVLFNAVGLKTLGIVDQLKSQGKIDQFMIWSNVTGDADAVKWANQFGVLDELHECRWGKAEVARNRFLQCDFCINALDMGMLLQFVAFAVLVVLVIAGLGFLRRFRWAWTANVRDGLKGGARTVRSGTAKAKRVVGLF
jgi:hypothetical protein